MLSWIPGNQDLEKSFCWGERDTIIVGASRIMLPKAIYEILKSKNVTELWRSPALPFKGIVLCPPQNEKLYRKMFMKYLQNMENEEKKEIVYREYMSPGSKARLDKQRRITLTQACITRSKFMKGNSITILGMGMWYEVWHHDDLVDYRNKKPKKPFVDR